MRRGAGKGKPYIRLLGMVAGLDVWLVSGQYVRDHIDIDFTMGGNEAIYPRYNPRGEIWIDDAAGWPDRNATALHEIVERDQMIRFHKGYDKAHDVASAHERPFRVELRCHRPTGFDAARVAAAYRAYLKAPDAPPVIGRPNDRPRSPRVLEAEIRSAIGRTK